MEFNLDEVPRATVLDMLRAEDAMRKSDEMQQLYDKTRHIEGDQVERYIQRNVLKGFGFIPSVENLRSYWGIRAHYGDDDDELMDSVIYLRYAHLLKECSLTLGDACPDASLFSLDGISRKLTNFIEDNDYLVILAGSMT